MTYLSALSVASRLVVVGVGVLRPAPLVGLFLRNMSLVHKEGETSHMQDQTYFDLLTFQ